ncbi:cobalamin-binding protein [Haloferax mediterranei ATCC 33500]|uniref:Cobalamin ABC transporter substrate-binding protein n=1 Tax=Haloferax mediterranei (strain ATCC 33500 / DSM 1411 / JCM 8866 / NBRC 14739 / NCIMB 2177 / R-4) TaxID=523841 RepID=I3R2M5_HALMT|nr:helical backbone metal receptor [Haloferax mediterranei]AFK18485.1 iron(III ABC transporter periplasmic substrate-binding protein ABC transporter periplasmic substrate-binding protein) [Haloferax mediterranei ATCC 33500]AHZ22133.1 cobalamin ABC transporter substrate-binding protein [Haloferax mediterranei ATCC 33500]EMA02242.1 iron(III) ABC transporter periplasmic substrate-binding protein [Haloferax mediterranei ATCC 33500]MDX5988575.1 helical backbone metal receptor [Haloferax mediterranei
MSGTPRIVSLAPSATAILDAAGLASRVVGATVHSSLDRPAVGGWLNPDFERIEALDPDTLCTADDLQTDVTAEARERGFDVVHVAPETLDDVLDSFPVVCDAAGDATAGAALADDCRTHLDRVAAAVDDYSRPTVYCEEWADPPMAAGNWVPDVVRAAGGTYPFLDAGERSREVDADDVAAADPAHVVLHPCGKGERGDPDAFEAREWGVDAAVHAVDDSLLNQPSPALMSGVDRLARLFHPDADLPEPWLSLDADLLEPWSSASDTESDGEI